MSQDVSDVISQIKKDISDNAVVLFMKGTKNRPQCGFSHAVVQILMQLEVDFKDINVLENFVLREEIKKFSDWPTIPQLYVKSEFIGGSDIVREMKESGELVSLLQQSHIPHLI